jgi:hypothetical protein
MALFPPDVGDGGASHLMPQIGQCASNSSVAPRRIIKCHAKNEINDRFHDARSAWAAPVAVVPLGRHQFPIPSQQRVRRDQGFKLIQHLAPECLRFSGESTAFGIREARAPPTHAPLKHAILFLDILNHVQRLPNLRTSGGAFEQAEAVGTLRPSRSVPQPPCPIPQPRSTSNGIVRIFGQYGFEGEIIELCVRWYITYRPSPAAPSQWRVSVGASFSSCTAPRSSDDMKTFSPCIMLLWFAAGMRIVRHARRLKLPPEVVVPK